MTASGDPITNGSLSQSMLSRSFPFASKDVRPAQEGKRRDGQQKEGEVEREKKGKAEKGKRKEGKEEK
jgi:hypothetical protein